MATTRGRAGMVTIPTCVSQDTFEHLEAQARTEKRSIGELAGRAVEESVRIARFPRIRFIGTPTGERKAILQGGHSVWGIVFNARGLDMDVERTAQHLEIPVESVRVALDFYDAYPEEIDEHLRRLEEFAEDPTRFCPSIRVVEVPDEGDATPS